MNGAMFQMIAHGISSAGMFFMVGVIYDRVHHRNLNEFGGLFQSHAGVHRVWRSAIFFAGLGLPGLCGFIGEVLVTLVGLEFQPHAGSDFGGHGHSDGGIHFVDNSARLLGTRIQGPAWRSFVSDHGARSRDCGTAVGAGHFVRRVSAGAVSIT